MADNLKSSAAIWGEQPDTREDLPPAYSGVAPATETNDGTPGTSAASRPVTRRPHPRIPYDPLRRLAPLSYISYQKYNTTDGVLSPDKISFTVKHSDLYADPQHLLPFILEQAGLPPKPTLRIVGSRGQGQVDFDITLNLTHLLDLHNPRSHVNSAHVTPFQSPANSVIFRKDDPSVHQRITTGIKQFCQDRSENKSYTLRRTVEGLPTENLAGQIRNLAASIKYRGRIRIDFTDERSKVTVHKQPTNWLSNVLKLHGEKQYQVVETVWRISDGSDGGEDRDVADMGIRAGHEWWQSWAGTIRNAMISRHKGNVGIEDWIETKMGRLEAEPKAEWGKEYPS